MKPLFLEGVRFVDLTWAGAGSFSTKIFSDFGAEIIKVESVSRADPVRLAGPFRDGVAGLNRSGYFASRNTGKKSLALNLKNEEARGIVRELIRCADVVSNNFGPGAMERLGFGYEDVKAIKSDIVYLAMPMYGEDGPLSGLLGVGMTISAVTGLMWLTGHRRRTADRAGHAFPRSCRQSLSCGLRRACRAEAAPADGSGHEDRPRPGRVHHQRHGAAGHRTGRNRPASRSGSATGRTVTRLTTSSAARARTRGARSRRLTTRNGVGSARRSAGRISSRTRA